MMYCRTCGQCLLIDPELEQGHFYTYQRVQAWQYISFNHENGEVNDWGDIDDVEPVDDPDAITCPYCEDNDVIIDWEGTEREARAVRESYDLITRQRMAEIEEQNRRTELKQAGVVASEWDDEHNTEEEDKFYDYLEGAEDDEGE